MRKKIYQMVHVYDGNALSITYKYFMIAVIAASLLPLTFKQDLKIFGVVDKVCLVIFIIDYLLRWVTADYKFNKNHWSSFVKYPFRLISIIDLMSIFALTSSAFVILEGIEIAEALSVFRLVRIFRYSKSVRTILLVFKKSRKPLTAVGSLAIGYILISAIVMFNIEPESFNSFYDAIYWSTVSLTTVGYGDIYPISALGRFVAMLSSFFGIAIVALPAGIVTAEYMSILKNKNDDSDTAMD